MASRTKPWPTGLPRKKDSGHPDDPLAYRLLTLLTVLYRRWASLRLHDLAPWAESWGMEEMYAGVGTNGAEDAWMDLGILVELWQLSGTPFAGGATDIVKCFDQIDRDLLYQLARIGGMPDAIIDTYQRFMEGLVIHNSVAGGVGKPYSRRCDIPQ